METLHDRLKTPFWNLIVQFGISVNKKIEYETAYNGKNTGEISILFVSSNTLAKLA